MKKIFITLAALFVVGMVSAQTDTTGTGKKNTTGTETTKRAKKGQHTTRKSKDTVSGQSTRPADKDRRKNNGTTPATTTPPTIPTSGGNGTNK